MRWAAATVLYLLLPGPVEAQDSWTKLDGPIAEPTLRIREGAGWLEARGDQLVRIVEGSEIGLLELPGRPTGTIRDLVDDPHGGAIVAAENGVFLTHPSVDTIDRIDLRDGSPPGSPVGIVLDARRRLWIATTTSFGVVETLSFYGRTQGSEDGLPPGPYSGLSRHPDGGLVLGTPSGAWRYRPDRGAPPRITVVSIDGETWSEGPLMRNWPVTLEVAAAGRGLGGVSLRYVEDDRHNWLPLPAAGTKISGMSPGRRSISVVVLDRDLRRSALVRVPFSVSYPDWLRPRYVALVVIGFALAVLGLVLLGARRAGGGRSRYAHATVSAGLIVWAVLQLVAAIFPHVRGWPFCGFSMYTWSAKENAISGPVGLKAITEDGREFVTELRRFGLPVGSQWLIIRPFLNGDEAFRRQLLERYNRRAGENRAAVLMVVQRRQRLTSQGKIPVAPLVMGAIEAQR